MKKTLIASLIGLAYGAPVLAADDLQLNDVVITATRTPQAREAIIADVSVINEEQIQRSGQSTLVELLRLQPGIEISQTGGAGQSSAIFMRGTNSNHVVILIDGMRISSASLGTTALENIQLSQISRIEILRGPATSLYGQDAIGGVIQLFTKGSTSGQQISANIGSGSYGTTLAEAGVYGSFEDTSYALSASTRSVDGFSSLGRSIPTVKDDDAYSQWQVNGELRQKLALGHEMGIQFFNSDGKVEYDNRYNLTAFNSKTYMNQQALSLTSKNQITEIWLSKIRVGFSRDRQRNYDEFPIYTRFDTEQTQLNWQNDFALKYGTLTLMYDRLEDELNATTRFSKSSRANNGLVASFIGKVGAHTLQTSYRNDQNEQYGHYDSGNLGYGYQWLPQLKLTANLGTALKAPSFNDLYFPFTPYGGGFSYSGNPNLSPERSFNKELAAIYDDGVHRLSATLFENKIRDLIQASQNIAADSPINLPKVTIQGITLSASHQNEQWLTTTTLDIQSPRNDETGNLLVRRANRHGTVSLVYRAGDWQMGAELVASSNRYEDAANTKTLAGYSVINVTGQYQIHPNWLLQARLNNILDKEYALASNGFPPTYPFIDYKVPGSNLFVNLRYQFK